MSCVHAEPPARIGDDLDSFFGSSMSPLAASSAASRPMQQAASKPGGHQPSPLGDPFFAGSPPLTARPAPAACPPQASANGDDDDFLGSFGSPTRVQQISSQAGLRAPDGGATNPMRTSAPVASGTSAAAPTSQPATLDADDDFMSSWAAANGSSRTQPQQATSSVGDPFDLFGDAGGTAAVPVATLQPQKPAEPPKTHSQASSRPAGSGPSSPVVSRVASPTPQLSPASPVHVTDDAHFHAAPPPPAYGDVIGATDLHAGPIPPQRPEPTRLDRFSSTGPTVDAPADAGMHPNFPRGPSSGKPPGGAGGAFWAREMPPQRDAVNARPAPPRVSDADSVPQARPAPPRSQAAGVGTFEKVSCLLAHYPWLLCTQPLGAPGSTLRFCST